MDDPHDLGMLSAESFYQTLLVGQVCGHGYQADDELRSSEGSAGEQIAFGACRRGKASLPDKQVPGTAVAMLRLFAFRLVKPLPSPVKLLLPLKTLLPVNVW